MAALRSQVRYFSLLLLLVAAMDLAYPSGCAESQDVGPLTPTICAGHDSADAGHDGEDCFCCSRTVRAESSVAFHRVSPTAVLVNDTPVALVDALGPPLYHPPLG
jgi:hypothetical protein